MARLMPKNRIVSDTRKVVFYDRASPDRLAFQTRPLNTGNPWFLAPSIRYYRWRDRQPM
jgi:hypothetical protein